MQIKKLYVGCGEDSREGFLHADTRKLAHVDIVCKAWEISRHINEVEHIYTRHMLEHLTTSEVSMTLKDWYKSLTKGGTLYIVVPNADYHCKQWLKAEWTEETIKDKWSDASWSLAGFHGWQRDMDDIDGTAETAYWDLHKTSFNEKRMKFMLERSGFTDVVTSIKENVHLVATARKQDKN